MTYKDVCTEKEIWFRLSDKKKEGKIFLQWAKELGCVWTNGEEIDPQKGTDFFTLSINCDGKLANVPAMALAAQQFKTIKRVNFADFYKQLQTKEQ